MTRCPPFLRGDFVQIARRNSFFNQSCPGKLASISPFFKEETSGRLFGATLFSDKPWEIGEQFLFSGRRLRAHRMHRSFQALSEDNPRTWSSVVETRPRQRLGGVRTLPRERSCVVKAFPQDRSGVVKTLPQNSSAEMVRRREYSSVETVRRRKKQWNSAFG